MDTLQLVNELHNINMALDGLSNAIRSNSFWESNLFAALIGATSAIMLSAIISFSNYLKGKKRSELKESLWFAKQSSFLKPIELYKTACNTTYAGEYHDGFTGKTEIIPEKDINEKMVIVFRSKLKWWKFKTFWIRSMLKKVQKEIEMAKIKNAETPEDIVKCLERATELYDKIKKRAYKIHNEDWYTIH